MFPAQIIMFDYVFGIYCRPVFVKILLENE
jgi:hypothetical protein